MPTNVITLETAQNWARTWRENTNLKGFLIQRVNIDQLIAQPEVVDIRAYIGINDNGEATLMLVGVDDKGKDLIDENNHLIYDFNRPCPTGCDTSSQLF